MLIAIDIHTKAAATGNPAAAASMPGFGTDRQAVDNSALALRYAR